MTSTPLSRRALAAILAAASLVAPATALSADNGSTVKYPVRANVYVPPSPDTATRQSERWKANVYVPPVESYADQVSALSDEQLAAAYGTAIPNWIPTPAGTQTVAHPAVPSADDGASLWAVLGLALGCAALLGVAGLALVRRARRARRTVA